MDINFKVKDLTLSSEPKTCQVGDSVKDVVKLLQENRIGSIVVMDGEKIAGIFTERDYLKKVAYIDHIPENTPISLLMTPNPKTTKITDPVKKAAFLMRMGNFRHVVVIDEQDKFKTVLSVKDILDFIFDEQAEAL